MEDTYSEEEKSKEILLSTCTALGGFEEIETPDGKIEMVYNVGDEALACLKDLKRFIRADSQNPHKFVLHMLATFNVLETDLVPILLTHCHKKSDVAERFILACVELLVPMTWPLEKHVQEDEEGEEKDARDPNELAQYRRYKKALLVPGVFDALLAVIMNPLKIPFRQRSVRDQTIIRLVLYFLRNLTAISDTIVSPSSSSESWAMSSMQEELLVRFCESNIVELLLTIASTSTDTDASDWNVIVLEIFYNLLEHVQPKDAFEDKERSKSATSERLETLLRQEQAMEQITKRNKSSRHSRFGGTYSLQGWQNTQRRVFHVKEAGYTELSELMDASKSPDRRGVKRKTMDEVRLQSSYRTPLALSYLKQTAQSFLESYMERENKKIVERDYIRFFFTVQWFLEYLGYEQKAHRAEKDKRDKTKETERSSTLAVHSKANRPVPVEGESMEVEEQPTEQRPAFDFDLVASVMDLRAFLLCLRRLRVVLDNKLWRDVQITTDCFRHMLVTISNMSNAELKEYRDVADYIQSNIYHEQSSFDLFVDLIKHYKSQSYIYLESVVQLTHVLLKLIEKYSKSKQVLFVRKTGRKKENKSKPKTDEREETEEDEDMDKEDHNSEEDERDHQIAMREHLFKFESFEGKYITDDVVRVYCVLLEKYQTLHPDLLYCIISLFHRIMKTTSNTVSMKLPVLELFNRILHDSPFLPKNSSTYQLIRFIRYCVERFVAKVQASPLTIVEAIFKTTKKREKYHPEPNLHSESEEEKEGTTATAEEDQGEEEDPFAVFYQQKEEMAAAKEAEARTVSESEIKVQEKQKQKDPYADFLLQQQDKEAKVIDTNINATTTTANIDTDTEDEQEDPFAAFRQQKEIDM
ncbi:timeless protein-domain-containing protein [Spinellus fusiger]|nr:timeless protein-domain-containing protein [Spinellus fusiger]